MVTKLTLRLDSGLIATAKAEAAKRGKSLSQLVADYVMGLKRHHGDSSRPITPLVASLRGIMKDKLRDPKKMWRKHLEEKYR